MTKGIVGALLVTWIGIAGCSSRQAGEGKLDREALDLATAYFHSQWLACGDVWVHKGRGGGGAYFSEIREPVVTKIISSAVQTDVDVLNGNEYAGSFQLGSHFSRRRPYDWVTRSFAWEPWVDMGGHRLFEDTPDNDSASVFGILRVKGAWLSVDGRPLHQAGSPAFTCKDVPTD